MDRSTYEITSMTLILDRYKAKVFEIGVGFWFLGKNNAEIMQDKQQ